MNELYHFKKYLDDEMKIAFSNDNPLNNKEGLDIARIDNLQTVMRIVGEYEHFVVNCTRVKIK